MTSFNRFYNGKEVLLSCQLCGCKVSSKAYKCPNCGSPNFISDTDYQNLEETYKETKERHRIEDIMKNGALIQVFNLSHDVPDEDITFDGVPFDKCAVLFVEGSFGTDRPWCIRLGIGKHTIGLITHDGRKTINNTKIITVTQDTHTIKIHTITKERWWRGNLEFLGSVDIDDNPATRFDTQRGYHK